VGTVEGVVADVAVEEAEASPAAVAGAAPPSPPADSVALLGAALPSALVDVAPPSTTEVPASAPLSTLPPLAARGAAIASAVVSDPTTTSPPESTLGHFSLVEACLAIVFPGGTSAVTCSTVPVRRRRP
jgi:hypothetical protein